MKPFATSEGRQPLRTSNFTVWHVVCLSDGGHVNAAVRISAARREEICSSFWPLDVAVSDHLLHRPDGSGQAERTIFTSQCLCSKRQASKCSAQESRKYFTLLMVLSEGAGSTRTLHLQNSSRLFHCLWCVNLDYYLSFMSCD